MNKVVNSLEILMAEDDAEDQLLVREAFRESNLGNRLNTVQDGEELLECLLQRGRFRTARRPDLILLDLNMPRKDGRTALVEIKRHPHLRLIPVIVLTTSAVEEDIVRSYELGVCSYIRKPVTFDKLVALVATLGRYWFDIVELPCQS